MIAAAIAMTSLLSILSPQLRAFDQWYLVPVSGRSQINFKVSISTMTFAMFQCVADMAKIATAVCRP